jgi:hypothetical protein
MTPQAQLAARKAVKKPAEDQAADAHAASLPNAAPPALASVAHEVGGEETATVSHLEGAGSPSELPAPSGEVGVEECVETTKEEEDGLDRQGLEGVVETEDHQDDSEAQVEDDAVGDGGKKKNKKRGKGKAASAGAQI